MNCFPVTDDINECGAISANFTFEQDALITNFDDIYSYTRNSQNPSLIESIVLKTTANSGVAGKKFYKILFREDNPMGTLVETTEEKSYAKPSKVEGELVVYGRTPEAANIKRLLDSGKHVVILKQASQKGTNAYYVVLGLESGLKPAAGENFVGDKGGYVHKFMADNLTYPQEFIYTGAINTTETLIAGLQVATV